MLAPHHFSSKEFEILDLDPPINATSHYGACHFRYNLALKRSIAKESISTTKNQIEFSAKREIKNEFCGKSCNIHL